MSFIGGGGSGGGAGAADRLAGYERELSEVQARIDAAAIETNEGVSE